MLPQSRKDEIDDQEVDNKKGSPYSITKSPENFFIVAGAVLCWLYYNQATIFSWKNPTIILLYWVLIALLIVIFILAVWFYSKILADVFLKPENLSKTAVIKIIKSVFKWGIFIYIYIVAEILSLGILINLIYLFFLYYLGEKIYIRIIKKVDFIAESEEQRFRTRKNNRFLLLFPLWYLITSFTSNSVTYVISAIYLLMFLIWYHKWPLDEEDTIYTITRAELGSPERLELLREALESVDEEFTVYDDIDNVEEFGEFEYSTTTTYEDIFDGFKIEDENEDEEEELKIEVNNKRLARSYLKDKIYPIHEYYLWWWMKDVPFYFTIKAIYYMFMDISCAFLRLICTVPILVLLIVVTALPLGVPVFNQTFWTFNILLFASFFPWWWLGNLNIYVFYSWYAFFEREDAYRMYDEIHPYAMTGPTVDGPHNWQYWFYVLFSYFPSNSLILQEQLWDEEIRLTEVMLELSYDFMEEMSDMDDDEEQGIVESDIWNPIDLFWLRKASPAEVKKYKERLQQQEKFQVPPEVVAEWKKTITHPPQWWRHYYL